MNRKVWIDNYSWFNVLLDSSGEAEHVTECRIVWSRGSDPANKMMSERVRRAIEQAKRQSDEQAAPEKGARMLTGAFSDHLDSKDKP